MKRILLFSLAVAVIFLSANCSPKSARVEPAARDTSGIERVDEKTPVTQRTRTSGQDIVETEAELRRINFDFDQYTIRDDMKPILQANAQWLARHKSSQIVIEGHCDERGTVEYNIALGEKRAEAAKGSLVSLGVAADRIKVISFGKSRPLVRGVDEATWFQNRRAEFLVLVR